MYYIKLLNKRYNNLSFINYEEARKYLRRKITELSGAYRDSFGELGFTIAKK